MLYSDLHSDAFCTIAKDENWLYCSKPFFKKKKKTIDTTSSPQPFLAPGTSFMEDNFFHELETGWFQDDSSALHLLYTLI